jgi:hypothetical protein
MVGSTVDRKHSIGIQVTTERDATFASAIPVVMRPGALGDVMELTGSKSEEET